MTDNPTTGQIIEQLKASLTLAELHHQANRITIARRDAQIAAMSEEIERLREANRRLWAELCGKDEGGGMKDE